MFLRIPLMFVGTLLLSALMAPVASARMPECGVYVDEVTKLHIEVVNDTEAVEYQLSDQAVPINRIPLLIHSEGNDTYAFPAEWSDIPGRSRFTLSQDGTRLRRDVGPGRDFARVRRQPCRDGALPPPGPCRLGLNVCMDMLRNPQTPAAPLKAACDEGVAYACMRWIEVSQLDVAGIAQDERRAPMPSDAEVAVAVDPPRLDATILDRLPAICERHRSVQTCKTIGDVLWRGSRPTEALAAWRTGCSETTSRDLSSLQCAGYPALEAQLGDRPQAVAASALPCGRYRSQIWEIEFGSDGTARLGTSEGLAVKLEDGDIVISLDPDIRLRLRPLASGQMIGFNNILVQQVFDRDPASGCAPPQP